MKRETDREGGFTRVDALVTIIVITMIVTTSLAALVPAMNKAREAAMRARCANQMRQIGAAIAMYADVYDGWLPFYGGKDPNFTDLDPPYTVIDVRLRGVAPGMRSIRMLRFAVTSCGVETGTL